MIPPEPPDVRADGVARRFRPRVLEKKIAAITAVDRERKLADPEAPKTVPELPDPKAAPISAPFPCWRSTSTMMPRAEST